MTEREQKKLAHLSEFSRYLGRLFDNEEFRNWLLKGGLRKNYPMIELYKELKNEVSEFKDIDDIKRAFRRFKQRHFLRLGVRDFLQDLSFNDLVIQISNLAEVCLQTGIEILSSDIPKEESANCRLAVLGLGKLGGKELNYASDIDLIYIYDQKDKSIPCSFYTSMVQKLNDIMGDIFEGDRVFKVDMRLRPKGRYGELVQSYDSVVEHYLIYGQAWERQALLKARGVAGDRNLASLFLSEIRPFVFRRFLDFQAISEIKSMRDKILEETEQQYKDYTHDVKLGIGGIREVEFITQAFQLIYGGRCPELAETNTLICLDKLARLKLMPQKVIDELKQGYIFLRRVEHWIQLDRNRQSSKIPKSDSDRQRLSRALGFATTEEFFDHLNIHTKKIHTHFKELFHETSKSSAKKPVIKEEDKYIQIHLRENKARIPIANFEPGFQKKIKNMLEELSDLLSHDAFYGFAMRVGTFLSKVEKRPGLKKFLEDNQNRAIEILSAIGRSRFVSSLLNYQPSLIEGVFNDLVGDFKNEWKKHAEDILAPLNFEDSIEWIRKIKNERMLTLAIQDLKGDIHLYDLLYSLTELAEFVIHWTYKKVLEHLNIDMDFPLAILGLGKLGSRELGYFSDLDLMYVYRPLKGENPDIIPNKVINIVQRFNNALKMPMQEGPGYEVDTRLRPTGNYGPLIVTLNRWKEYYTNEADIWEIQSLLKLRPIAGNVLLLKKINELKYDFCSQKFDERVVWQKISHMRDRIVNERSKETEGVVDIKTGRGGLIDLEFFVQGMLLTGKVSMEDAHNKNYNSLLIECLNAFGKDQEFINILSQIHINWLYLIQRIHLLTNLSSSRITREKFLDIIQMGLWPPKDTFLIEEFEDIIKYKRIVDRFWQDITLKFY